jgi:hypothetical protein
MRTREFLFGAFLPPCACAIAWSTSLLVSCRYASTTYSTWREESRTTCSTFGISMPASVVWVVGVAASIYHRQAGAFSVRA